MPAPRPKKEENVAIGKRLARLRTLFGLTQGALAVRVGWLDGAGDGNRARVAQLETGRVAFSNVDQREIFAQVFGLSLLTLNGVLRGDVTPEVAQRMGFRALTKRAQAAAKYELHAAMTGSGS